jgi:hypothetical protein
MVARIEVLSAASPRGVRYTSRMGSTAIQMPRRLIAILGMGDYLVAEAARCFRKRAPWPHRLLSFAGLRFHGLGCGKFPISVWLGAQGIRLQFTDFRGLCTTSWARHG